MGKGEFIKGGYTVQVGEGGSFVVVEGDWGRGQGIRPAHRGFTDYLDLLAWLKEEHEANESRSADTPMQAATENDR